MYANIIGRQAVSLIYRTDHNLKLTHNHSKLKSKSINTGKQQIWKSVSVLGVMRMGYSKIPGTS